MIVTKRICTAVASMVLCLASCGCTPQYAPIAPPAVPAIDWAAFSPGRYLSIMLSFRSSDNEYLVFEPREVYVEQGELVEEVAVQALLSGPESEGLHASMPSGVTLDRVELSGKIANVMLNAEGVVYPDEILIARAALINTLSALGHVEYVNLYIDNKEPGYFQQPLGAVSEYVSDLSEYMAQLRREMNLFSAESASLVNRTVTLYFPDPVNEVLIAETRELDIASMFFSDYVDAILNELLQGSVKSDISSNPFSNVRLTAQPNRSILSNGRSTVTIYFDYEPQMPLLAYGAIVYSIIGFVPEVEFVRFYVASEPVEYIEGASVNNGLFVKENFAGLIGDYVEFYIPKNGQLAQQTVRSVLYYRHAYSPRFLLETIIDYDAAQPEPALRTFPEGMTRQYIQDAFISGDIALVNFDERFISLCTGLSSAQEFTMVYAIVNSLCRMYGVTRVQFLVDGQPVGSLAGNIQTTHPLYPNHGLQGGV